MYKEHHDSLLRRFIPYQRGKKLQIPQHCFKNLGNRDLIQRLTISAASLKPWILSSALWKEKRAEKGLGQEGQRERKREWEQRQWLRMPTYMLTPRHTCPYADTHIHTHTCTHMHIYYAHLHVEEGRESKGGRERYKKVLNIISSKTEQECIIFPQK